MENSRQKMENGLFATFCGAQGQKIIWPLSFQKILSTHIKQRMKTNKMKSQKNPFPFSFKETSSVSSSEI